MWQDDPLEIRNAGRFCQSCENERHRRKKCQDCGKTGYPRIDLAGLWRGKAGFLVCGGPSLKNYQKDVFTSRGIVSLGVNNAAAFVQTTAFTFGDDQWKFAGELFLDPKVLCFVPTAKLSKTFRIKNSDGSWSWGTKPIRDYPGNFGLPRNSTFFPLHLGPKFGFLRTWHAQWGWGGKHREGWEPFTKRETMLLGLRLMHYLGCERVYMLGVDFGATEEKSGYAWGDSGSCGSKRFRKANEMLHMLKEEFEQARFHVYNCAENSACDAFPCVSFEDALLDCQGSIRSNELDLSGWYSKKAMLAEKERNPETVELK